MTIQFVPIITAAAKIIPKIPWNMLPKLNQKNSLIQYEHFKGGVYTVLLENVCNEADNTLLTVYQGSDGTIWARPSIEFHGYINGTKRFKPINKE